MSRTRRPSADPATAGDFVAYRHRGLVAVQLAVGALFTVLMTDLLITHRWLEAADIASSWMKGLMWLTLVASLLIMIAGVRELLSRNPTLEADQIGLTIALPEVNRSTLRIPWAAIRAVNLRVSKVGRSERRHALVLRLDPAAWSPPDWLVDSSRYELHVDGLDRRGPEVFRALRAAWEARGGVRAELGEMPPE